MITFDSEKCLEDSIYEAMKNGSNPINDSYVQYCGRQVDLGGHGIIDLVAVTVIPECGKIKQSINITLIELKNEKIKLENLVQIAKYRTAITRLTDEGGFKNADVEVDCILVFKDSDPCSAEWPFLLQNIEWLDSYQFEFSFEDGVVFKLIDGYTKNKERLDVAQKSIFDIIGLKKRDE